MKHDIPIKVNRELSELLDARSHDPLAVLGPHGGPRGVLVRVFDPYAQRVEMETPGGPEPFQRVHPAGIFEWHSEALPPTPYRMQVSRGGDVHRIWDPYAFAPSISDHDLYLFNEGRLLEAWNVMGARPMNQQGVPGVRFACWAPNAERVSVVGEFNRWDGRVHPMQSRGASGAWELFIPGLTPGTLYKFEIRHRHSGTVMTKADPWAKQAELRPGTASCVAPPSAHAWRDADWMSRRASWDWLHAPVNIYELHAGSWRRHPDGRFCTWGELAAALVPYLADMGYSHVELLPVSEHPLDESWGYQSTGYFAPTSRFGSPDEFRAFVDACHLAGIGVILDWVPGHFPQDRWALARFDGTALYEHEDPRLGLHQDWGTHIFNYGRNEVRGFLLSSAHYWLAEFHLDGLRVDAVASMLYLDYSRRPGEWLPNRFGGRENLEAIDFLRELNVMVHERFPGALTFAEESTAWPMVSRPAYLGGLGFSCKWNMGWMHDSLEYAGTDPVYRRFHHDHLTFGQLYAYTENFVLPFSHDEVVHGKRSLLDRMPGDPWQKFAGLRLLFSYQMTYPGKKLNFMGNEFAQGREWAVQRELDWALLDLHWHAGVQAALRDLNRLYRDMPALHDLDFDQAGFQWVECHDAEQSVLAYLRRARDGGFVLVALNFTPVPRQGYRLGVPQGGLYREIFNSDAAVYGGSNIGNGGAVRAREGGWGGFPYTLELTLPPLAGVILAREG